MSNEQRWVSTLQKAIRANFAINPDGRYMSVVSRYEHTIDSARAMYFGIMTDKLGVDYAKNAAFTYGNYDYDELMREYERLLLLEEASPKNGDHGTWFRYLGKRELVLRYFKYGKK